MTAILPVTGVVELLHGSHLTANHPLSGADNMLSLALACEEVENQPLMEDSLAFIDVPPEVGLLLVGKFLTTAFTLG